MLTGSIYITELMAGGGNSIVDDDGEASDWIELFNSGSANIDLAGWHLTDDPEQLDKWEFPSTTLEAGEYLVVYASGKDRDDSGNALHTNFALSEAGEYLGLIRDDGVTVEHEFTLGFPEQRDGLSFGLAPSASETLIAIQSPARAHVPSNGSLGLAWTEVGFDDQAWQAGQTGVGYENGTGYEPYLNLDLLDQMFGMRTSAYIRVPFTVAEPESFDVLTLRMQYDDGFVAYLNGERVAERNAPTDLAWDSPASQQNSDQNAVEFERIDLSAHRDHLKAGTNVLAIHALNDGAQSSDLLIHPELVGSSAGFNPNETRYFTTPTPGEANGDGVLGLIADTDFSVDRGFYNAPFQVEITTNVPSANIIYTTDGTIPTEAHGTLYSGPITIGSTTTLRAYAYLDDYLPSNVDTQTYIFLDDVLTQPANVPGFPNPTINIGGGSSVPMDYEMDPEVVGDPAYAPHMTAAMTSIPSIALSGDVDEIFDAWLNGSGSGSGIEYPVSIEFLYPDDASRNDQAEAGLRPHSHRYLKRSLRLVFRSEYGDAKLDHDLFADAPLDSGTAVDQFDRLVLRAGGNRNFINHWNPDDTTYTRDQWARSTQLAMSGVGSHGTFAHVYINGVYMGLYNPVERPDHFFQASYFGGHQDDYFAINHGGTISGDASRWNYLKGTLKSKDMSQAANYAELRQYLDVEQFADYVLLNFYSGTDDWPTNNWYGGYYTGDVSGGDPGPMRFFIWDAEDIWDDHGSSGPFNRSGGRGNDGAWITSPEFLSSRDKDDNVGDIARIFHSLRDSQEFMQLFADRAYYHLFHDGALTDANSQARWSALNDYVRDAVIGESARWGDARQSLSGEGNVTRTRDGVWQTEVDRVHDQSMPGNANATVQVLRGSGYYPSIDPATFSQHGGTIEPGFQFSLTNPNSNSTLYYTLDGSDPRLAGGGIASTASAYGGGTITLDESTKVSLRVLKSGEWSALNDATFLLNATPPLRITEIMYNPTDPASTGPEAAFSDNDDFEFVELQNIGQGTINLDGVQFADGIGFTFGNVDLAADEYIVVAKNQAAFDARYDIAGSGINFAGSYTGSLDNKGETLQLEGKLGEVILDFDFDDGWYPITDGDGFSLTIVDPNADPATWGSQPSWRPSGPPLGTPGASDSGVAPGAIVISEVLTHSDGVVGDWIELRNTTSAPIEIGGWYLSDSDATESDLKKYRIADGTILGGGDHVVFTQAANFGIGASDIGSLIGFGLSELGEGVHLSSALAGGVLTGYRESESFGAAEREVTFGRFETSESKSHFPAMSQPTFGTTNAAPRVGPIVINEIMYDPAGNDPEFVELRNISGAPVNLFDPANPANTWQFTDGITFTFPINVTLQAGGYLLLTPNDPATFRTEFNVPAAVAIYQYSGALNNAGEAIALAKPGQPELSGFVPLIEVERVKYNDKLPWPTQAAGGGSALARLTASDYGNDPINWVPSTSGGTPGRVNQTLDFTPPSVPTDVTASVASTSRIDLSWSPASDPESGVSRYVVMRNNVEIGTSTSTTYSDTSAEADMQYSYQVIAHNGDNVASDPGLAAAVSIISLASVHVLDATHLQLTFSQPVTAGSANNAGNYSAGGLTITSASLAGDSPTVTLTTSTISESVSYTLIVSNLIGTAGGQLPPATTATFVRSSRVSNGLVVLYDLEEGQGNLVRDVSAFGAPLDLVINDPNAVTWIEGGLNIDSSTIIRSPGAATKIHDAITASGAVTIEAWVKPTTINQSGPARIATLSSNTSNRSFTLGQELDGYQTRFRTTTTGVNGINPSLTTSGGEVSTDQLDHVVYTRDATGNAVIYVDGIERGSVTVSGNLSNWDASYLFALANEISGDRPWQGAIHLVAVYDRALTAAEVTQNFQAGADPVATPTATVVDRRLFYADSAVPEIAFDKTPLLAGGTASFANLSSYRAGINGIVVDVSGADLAAISSADFSFRIGRVNDTTTWQPLLTPPSINRLPGEGIGESDRLALTWPAGTITNTWFEVTLKATTNTGLAADDTFYFGNQIGDTNGDGQTNASDFAAIRGNPSNFLTPATVDNRFDLDRDRRVNATDLLIVRDYATGIGTGLPMITPSGSSPVGNKLAGETLSGTTLAPPEPTKAVSTSQTNLNRQVGGTGSSDFETDFDSMRVAALVSEWEAHRTSMLRRADRLAQWNDNETFDLIVGDPLTHLRYEETLELEA